MTITKEQNGSDLVIALEGRLDSMTAPELGEELKTALNGVTNLTLDFAKLEYVSSAGLRVLLVAANTMKDKDHIRIINANEIIREVFEVTGFNEILPLE